MYISDSPYVFPPHKNFSLFLFPSLSIFLPLSSLPPFLPLSSSLLLHPLHSRSSRPFHRQADSIPEFVMLSPPMYSPHAKVKQTLTPARTKQNFSRPAGPANWFYLHTKQSIIIKSLYIKRLVIHNYQILFKLIEGHGGHGIKRVKRVIVLLNTPPHTHTQTHTLFPFV